MRADQYVVLDAEIGEDAAVLKGPSESEGGDSLGAHSLDRPAVEPDRAGVGAIESADEVEGGRLAGAVGADHADEFALVDMKIEALDRGDAAETPRQSLNFEQAVHRRQTAPSRPCGRKRISSSSATP